MRLPLPKDRWAISDGTMFQPWHTGPWGSIGSRPAVWDTAQSQFLVGLEREQSSTPTQAPNPARSIGRQRKEPEENSPGAPAPPARPGYSFPGAPLKREDAIACARLLWPDCAVHRCVSKIQGMKNLNYPDQRQVHAKAGAPGPTDGLCPQGCDLTTPQWHDDMWSTE